MKNSSEKSVWLWIRLWFRWRRTEKKTQWKGCGKKKMWIESRCLLPESNQVKKKTRPKEGDQEIPRIVKGIHPWMTLESRKSILDIVSQKQKRLVSRTHLGRLEKQRWWSMAWEWIIKLTQELSFSGIRNQITRKERQRKRRKCMRRGSLIHNQYWVFLDGSILCRWINRRVEDDASSSLEQNYDRVIQGSHSLLLYIIIDRQEDSSFL